MNELVALADRKPPPGQLIPQNSSICPSLAVVEIPGFPSWAGSRTKI